MQVVSLMIRSDRELACRLSVSASVGRLSLAHVQLSSLVDVPPLESRTSRLTLEARWRFSRGRCDGRRREQEQERERAVDVVAPDPCRCNRHQVDDQRCKDKTAGMERHALRRVEERSKTPRCEFRWTGAALSAGNSLCFTLLLQFHTSADSLNLQLL